MNQSEKDKPLPSIEQSLKFMAWDLKQTKETIVDLNNNFKILIGILRVRSSSNEAPPF